MTTRAPGIDVIIPVFNGEAYIEAAIQSVLQQTLPPDRIIIVDDGSTDATAQVVARLAQADARVVCLPRSNAGVSAARNAGIAASSAPFIAFLDADDIWLPEKLERQMEAFDRGGSETGFVHSSYFFINGQGMRLPDRNVVPPKQRGDIFRPLLLEGYVLSGSASSVLVRRDVLDKAGHFDERLFHGEDWDLWIRLARISKVDFTPEAVVGIRVHDQSAQRRVVPGRAIRFFRQQLLVYAKWEALIGADRRFRASLRTRAVDAVLPVLRTPSEAFAFYRSLAAGESALTRSIFRNALHFWLEVGSAVLGILWRRMKRKAGLNDR
ncbi:glycosyltransferase family 2 protein [Pannonibacter indicus]|uniref:glycosyltransferase family 2 protein n=1 Tax=Pannonibacter indicus TaxID=466044 RepID=UPI0039198871